MLEIWNKNLAFDDKDLATYLYNFPIYIRNKKINSTDNEVCFDDEVTDFDLLLVKDLPVDPTNRNEDVSNKTMNGTDSNNIINPTVSESFTPPDAFADDLGTIGAPQSTANLTQNDSSTLGEDAFAEDLYTIGAPQSVTNLNLNASSTLGDDAFADELDTIGSPQSTANLA